MALVGFVGLALLVGAADGAIASGTARAWYLSLDRPPGALPEMAFGPIWAVLYVCCGLGGWAAWRRAGAGPALRLWGWQLFATAVRAAAFFGLRNPALSIAVGVLTLGLLVLVIHQFGAIRRGAAWLMVPSLLWTGYSLYLDAGILVLNPA